MRRRFPPSTVVLICAVVVSAAFGQDALTHMREIYHYDAWPGKTGSVKEEPHLDSLRILGCTLTRTATDADGTTYEWSDAQNKPAIQAKVKSHNTTEAAQAGLLAILSQYSRLLSNTESYGFRVGDIGFAMQEKDTTTLVAFVRNNITAVIKNLRDDDPLSVQQVAADIDSSI
jgi:hypothetical protein